jgi:glycosyltransferase involved in cell wall biosynthesis
MGTHEGLGLGFYESIYCGTPVLTLNWTPNNEIIANNVNGWLIDCDYGIIYDNNCPLINKAIVDKNNLKKGIINILENEENSINIINNCINNRDKIYNKNKKIFEKKIYKIFS